MDFDQPFFLVEGGEHTVEGKNEKMELAMADNEKVLESLRDTMEKDANRMASLKERVNFLEEEAKKKDDASVDLGAKLTKVEQVFADIAGWADAVYIEYKKALGVLGFEPLPLPEPAEGGEGVLRLMNWLVSEFEGIKCAGMH